MSILVIMDTTSTSAQMSGGSIDPSTYSYSDNIKTPKELGMSDKGTISQLSKDINGLNEYVNLLISGKSKASKAKGGPLGNKYFVNTGAKCKSCFDPNDETTCTTEDRYIYVNNVSKHGLISGAMNDLKVLNPANLMSSFSAGRNPACRRITLQTINTNNTKSSESHYVALVDIAEDHLISINKNDDEDILLEPNDDEPNDAEPITKKEKEQAKKAAKKEKEQVKKAAEQEKKSNKKAAEQAKKDKKKAKKENFQDNPPLALPDDPLAQLYLAGLSLLGIYILYRLMQKSR